MSHSENKYGLTFVQNYTMLAGALIVVTGLFILAILLFMPAQTTYWIFILHLTFCLGVTVALGIYDAKVRFKILQEHFPKYNKLGEHYIRLRINVLTRRSDWGFDKNLFRVRWNNGEYYIIALSIFIIVLAAFVPWRIIISNYSSFFKKDLHQSSYPYLLSFVMFTMCRFVRFLYWRWPLASLIQKKYGYSYKDLSLE